MQRPKLKEKYHVEQVAGEGVFLLAERETHVLEGQPLEHVVPWLDGRRDVDEIVAACSDRLPPHTVHEALNLLLRAGHLTESVPWMAPPQAAFWSELGIDADYAQAVLANTPVIVRTFGQVDGQGFIAAMRCMGLRADPLGAVCVALVDDYLHAELAALNSECLRRGMPLLLVKPVGVRLWVGPLVLPGRTACWRCLESRLRGNREVEAYVERRTGKRGPFPLTRARSSLGEGQAHAMAAMQLARWIVTGANTELASRVLVADVIAFSFEFHHVVRRPQCPACGDPRRGSVAGHPIHVVDRGATVSRQGGLRTEPPEAVYARLAHHVSPFTGIVSAVVPSLWHGAGPIRSYMAGHNFALKSDQLWFLKDGLRTSSSGKGRSDAQARTSALCEAIERYSGVFRGDEPRVRASFQSLGADAVDPRTCMLFSERQYRERESWLARGARFQVVPLPFSPHVPIDWTPVWSLTARRQLLLPTSYLYYNYQSDADSFFAWADSNGAAAGATPEDAMLQGLLELVERDAVALWWYNRLPRAAVDLDTFADDGFIAQMRDFYAQHGREFWVLDVTSDLDIPCFVAISRRVRGPTEDIMLGFGAHFDADIALSRALTELNQFIPALLNADQAGNTHYVMGDADALHWWRTATIENQPYLLGRSDQAPRRLGDFTPPPDERVAELVRALVTRLEAEGHEVLVLDQTRPDTGLPVMKMIVPGMRHFWARFAPGRLYDVPVKRGWLGVPTPEADLNPTPMFL